MLSALSSPRQWTRSLTFMAVALVVLMLLLLSVAFLPTSAEKGRDANMRLIAIGVVVRAENSGEYSVRTQVRRVLDLTYDPLYDRTLEAVGETVQVAEPITDAVVRGLHEEVGIDVSRTPYAVFGRAGALVSTRDKSQNTLDKYLTVEHPYMYVQTLKGPQPWVGLGFVVLVPPKTPATVGSDGEASNARWWNAEQLLEKLEGSRSDFMGFHYPVLKRVCQDLQSASSSLRKALDAENVVNTW